MKFKLNNRYFRWGMTAFLVMVAAILFYYFVFHGANIKSGIQTITNILMPIVWGFVIAYLLTPILNWIERKVLNPICNLLHIKESEKRNSLVRGIGIIFTAFLFVAMIYLFFHMLISQIVPSVQSIIYYFDSYINNFTKWLNRVLEDNPEFSESVVRLVSNYSDEMEEWLNKLIPNTAQLIKTVSLSVIGVIGVLWDFIIGFVISIYVLASKEKFAGQAKKMIYAIFEQDTANIVVRNFRFTHRTFIGFLSGKILDSIIIGILCFIGTSLLNTPYAALISVVVGVTNVIPFFGPYLGAIPSIILIFFVEPSQPLNCVYFALFILILQQFDGNVLGPKILGESTGLSGFWVIFSITLFGGLFGVMGMLIGVPFFAVIYAAVKSVVNTMLEKKALPIESEKYTKIDYVDETGVFHEILEPVKEAEKKKRKFFKKNGASKK